MLIGKAGPATMPISAADAARVSPRHRYLHSNPIGLPSAVHGSGLGAVVAGILGSGPLVPGTAEVCERFLILARQITAGQGLDRGGAL